MIRAFDLVGDSRRVTCELPLEHEMVYYAKGAFARIDDTAPPPAETPTTALPPPPKPVTAKPAPLAAGASLGCEVKATAGNLELSYTLREELGAELYMLDLLPDPNAPGNRQKSPLYLARSGTDAVRVVQGVAPLPSDRRVELRIVPEAWRVPGRGKVTRVVTLPLPLRETGPYDPPAPAHARSVPMDIERIVLDVHLMRSTARDFTRTDSRDIQGAHVVRSFDLFGDLQRVTCDVKIPRAAVYTLSKGFVRIEAGR